MCQNNGKRWGNFEQLDATKTFIEGLSGSTGIPADHLIDEITTGPNQPSRHLGPPARRHAVRLPSNHTERQDRGRSRLRADLHFLIPGGGQDEKDPFEVVRSVLTTLERSMKGRPRGRLFHLSWTIGHQPRVQMNGSVHDPVKPGRLAPSVTTVMTTELVIRPACRLSQRRGWIALWVIAEIEMAGTSSVRPNSWESPTNASAPFGASGFLRTAERVTPALSTKTPTNALAATRSRLPIRTCRAQKSLGIWLKDWHRRCFTIESGWIVVGRAENGPRSAAGALALIQ
jgi:hypothetical protein